MKTIRLLAAGVLLLCTHPLVARQTFRLADLRPEAVHQIYGTARIGRSVTGRPATVGGETLAEVIGTHAPSILKIDLHGTARSFRARVGVADNDIDYAAPSGLSPIALTDGSRLWYATDGDTRQFVGLARPDGTVGPGSVRFVVRGDGRDLYDSGILHAGDAPKSYRLDREYRATLHVTIPARGYTWYTIE
ncbi:NPCBM/NEW2 domain-containing protein [uncultured Rikenella sp.]|uniref:NPCBM/NEW2 domain-containing protein n=1 Tax=uncultured Rikenella sp. TaxID=368003 RepID=UPI00272A9D53|nr:NPCBM/NEW2 domain-containing protein [uncultured Rikenella sp.]